MNNNKLNIDIEELNKLIDKIDYIETFLSKSLPKVDKVIEKIETSSVFKQNIDELKENFNINIEELTKISNSLKEKLKDINNSKDTIKNIADIISELNNNLQTLKINIKSETLDIINKDIVSFVKDIKEKEKIEIDKMLENIKNIVEENNTGVQKIKDIILETGLSQKVRIYGFLGGLTVGLFSGILLVKLL